MDEYIGIVKLFAGTFAPRGWAYCDGSLLSIAQNTALFSILGTTYGGNGQTTFALPDLRSRVPVGAGNGPGLTAVVPGQMAGANNVTLLASQMPQHTHLQTVATQAATVAAPSNSQLPAVPNGVTLGSEESVSIKAFGPATGATTVLASNSIGVAGGNQPFSVMPPYTGMNYIICLQGIFPSRN